MKNIIHILLISILFGSISHCFGQDCQDGFRKVYKKSIITKEDITIYEDCFKPDKFDSPKDINGRDVEAISYKINSVDEVRRLVNAIFSQDELTKINEYKCMAVFVVSSSGKITSVSFYFVGDKRYISTKKLRDLSLRLKKEITYDLIFSKKVTREGFLNQTVPLYYIDSSSYKIR